MNGYTFPPANDAIIDTVASANWYGRANQLSREHVDWPVIDEVIAATKAPRGERSTPSPGEMDNGTLRSAAATVVDARQVIYQRRSCLALDGKSATTRDTFLRMIGRTLPGPHSPWDALYWPTMIHLAIFVTGSMDLHKGSTS